MAAEDHLSEAQWVPIEHIGGLRSQVPGLTVEQSYYDSPTRWDDYEQEMAQAKGYPSAQHYHEALKDHMRANGMENAVTWRGQDLSNGHHRYYAARDLGWSHIKAEPYQGQRVRDVPGWDK